MRRTSRRFLLARITQNMRNIRELEHDLFFQRRQLEFNLCQPHVSALEVARAEVHEKTSYECKERQKRKFDCMMRHTAEGTRPRQPDDRWVVNLSSRTLSAAERRVLARGLNFAPAPRRIPVTEIVTAVEDGLRRANHSEAQLARTRIVGCLNRARPPPTNLSPVEHKAIKLLNEDETVDIAPADKGNVTVMMIVKTMMERSGPCLLIRTHTKE